MPKTIIDPRAQQRCFAMYNWTWYYDGRRAGGCFPIITNKTIICVYRCKFRLKKMKVLRLKNLTFTYVYMYNICTASACEWYIVIICTSPRPCVIRICQSCLTCAGATIYYCTAYIINTYGNARQRTWEIWNWR